MHHSSVIIASFDKYPDLVMVVCFPTTCTCALGAYHHLCCEVEPLQQGVLDTTYIM